MLFYKIDKDKIILLDILIVDILYIYDKTELVEVRLTSDITRHQRLIVLGN